MLVFFDDILIYNKSLEEHVKHIDKVLQLYEKPSKCFFRVKEVEYLGHIVSHEGVKVDPKNLRGFLGLTQYYRKFVRKYRRIVAPLTTFLKKNAFSWTPKATQTFQQLKEAMCKAPVLATPDFTKTFIVECDSSGNGIGAVLMQEGNIISFTSHPIKGKNLQNPIMRRKC